MELSTKISVIVPVYNVEKDLPKCIDSILNQTHSNLQIILVDDGSTDNSSIICDSYAKKDARILVIHKKNGGSSSARNAGLDAVNGEYVGFVDSDDYIDANMYGELLSCIEVNGNVIANSGMISVNEYGERLQSYSPRTKPEITSTEEYLRELLMHLGDVSVCTKLFPSRLLKKLRFDVGQSNEDLLFMVNLILSVDKICYTGKISYFYLQREKSISSGYGKAVEDMVDNAIWVNDMVQSRYPKLADEASRFALHQHMAYLLLLPKKLAVSSNQQYVNARSFIRKNVPKFGWKNPVMSTKDKVVLTFQMICPQVPAVVYQYRRKIIFSH